MNFDLNLHFKKFTNNFFFNQIDYATFKIDILNFASALNTLTPDSTVCLKIKSPYLSMVAIIACAINKKLPVLVSHLEADLMILKLKSQIQFEFIITDSHFDNLAKHKDDHLVPISFHEICVVVFSSGTSSIPKGVALTFGNLYYSALGFSDFFKQSSSDTSLINLPHHHVGGLMILWRSFFSGGRVVTELQAPIDFISLVPLQLKRMLKDQAKLALLKKIRVILVGGAALSPSLKNESDSHGLSVYETYGMSETTSLVMINGEVLPYRQLRLDESGLFNIKGETLAAGYFINQNLVPFEQEWLKTNDVGLIMDNGRFQFKERTDLIFVSGGENINPLIIEEVVKQHPEITDAYLIPIPDEKWGEIGVLIYEAKSSGKQLNEELKKILKSSLHPHLVPKFFFSTPLNFEGQLKPKRSELKKIALDLYLKSLFSFTHISHPKREAPLLVLFHGFMGDKEDLIDCSIPLQSKYSILSIDLPGHGKTKADNFNSLDDILQKLAKFIQHFSPAPTYYGYSMGGRVALLLALQYLRPKQLILESAGLGLDDETEKSKRLNADLSQFNDLEQNQILTFLKNWYANPMFKKYTQTSRFAHDCEKKSHHDFNEWQKSQKNLSIGSFPTHTNTMEQIHKSSIPITYIYGEEDQKYKSAAMKLAKLKIPNILTYEILGAGHNPHKTHLFEITKTLSEILK